MTANAPAPKRDRLALTLGEAIVVLCVVAIAALFVLMALPRSRESARLAGCQRNLSQIGIALLQYAQIQGGFPTMSRYAPLTPRESSSPSQGPLRSLLETLQLPDFGELADPRTFREKRPNAVPKESPVRGFVCGSDPSATSGHFRAPISYRGCSGGDPIKPEGLFAQGRPVTPADVEAADGSGFTAAFSERLVGSGTGQPKAIRDYAVSSSPVPPGGCVPPAFKGAARNDAGSSWFWADYRSTLYNHALAPNTPTSCIAEDGESAFMGASSGHVAGTNLLLLDASLRTIRPSINLKIWRELGTIGSRRPTP